jgi:ECF sigma factor
MRRIIVDGARRKGAEVHGGHRERVALTEADWLSRATPDEIVALDDIGPARIDDRTLAKIARAAAL